ncbi:unnamed protein product [Tuber aestivum]|uniref:Uncharacterized protein n=1 Tax=Tuber aestivum TaxID=59557 RepID=A0A292PUZ6_9PEZI|nr:unnamed protein product [Tuber aestivum]
MVLHNSCRALVLSLSQCWHRPVRYGRLLEYGTHTTTETHSLTKKERKSHPSSCFPDLTRSPPSLPSPSTPRHPKLSLDQNICPVAHATIYRYPPIPPSARPSTHPPSSLD